ncbi:MAG: sensor histidine kinase [Anaerolineae bacterium]
MPLYTVQHESDKRTGYVVFLVVVAATLSAVLISFSARLTPLDISVLVAASIIYAFFGIEGFARLERASALPLRLMYFAVQIALAVVAMIVSGVPGLVALLIFPLAAQAAIILPRGWLLVVCVTLVASVAVLIGLMAGWPSVMPSATGYLVGVVFSVGLTKIAIREELARHEVERLAAELGAANDKLRAYAMQAEEFATTQERNRLAREIHDGLGHYLTAISMQLQAARAIWSIDPAKATDAVGKAQTLAREALTDVRRSVAALRSSPTDNRSLPEALAPLIEESCAAGIETKLTVSGSLRSLSPQASLALYRAAQEGLTNVRKHAHASRTDLNLDFQDAATVQLVVRDNGVGARQTDSGFGLIGLRERVQSVGGELRAYTLPAGRDGQGFILEVKVLG